MVGLAMCFHNFLIDYTIQKIKRMGLVMFLEARPTIGNAEPSYIMILFPLFLL